MGTKIKNKILIFLSAALMLFCAVFGISFLNRKAAKAEDVAAPILTIETKNLSYADSIYILYAVSHEGFDSAAHEIKMLFWSSTQEEYTFGTQSYLSEDSGTVTVKGKECLVFYSDGIAAKQMADDIFARAYVEVDGVAYYSDVMKFSVLEYVYAMREKGGLTTAQGNAFTALLNYGAATQTLLGYKTNRLANATYYKISVENGTLADGTAMGRYLSGDTVALKANPASEGKMFTHWQDSNGNYVSADYDCEITVTESETYTAVYQHYGVFYGFSTDGTYATVESWLGEETEALIESTYAGLPVTAIGEYAFTNSTALTRIIIPSSITTVGESAFSGCDNLTIYCEAESQPSGWDSDWNPDSCLVYWYSENEPALNADGTAYDGNYWRYDENGEINVWDEEEFSQREEEPVLVEKTISWTAGTHTGTQYANETYVVSDDLTMSSHNKGCHFTAQLRIYDSSTNDGWVILQYSGAVSSLAFNMGYKESNLNIYGSTDGNVWEEVGTIATVTAYKDYNIDVDETKGYTYIKLDPSGAQIRITKIDAVILVGENGGGAVTPPVQEVAEELKIYFPSFQSTKSGDCALIKVGNTEVLIDAGPERSTASVLVPYIRQYCTDGILEYVIVTHAHEDHIAAFVGNNGTDGIFANFVCQTIIDFPKTDSTSTIYNNYVTYRDKEVASGAVHYTALQCWNNANGAKQSYTLGGDITLNILYQEYYENSASTENNYSVCTMISYGEKHFLFTGDLETAGEASLIAHNDLPACELFKGGHHGSKTSNSAALLAVIKPEIVVFTGCAGSSQYTDILASQYPMQVVIDRVAPYTDKVYVPTMANGDNWAYLNGNLTIVCNGVDTTVTGSNNNLILKETEWFKTDRTMPDAWK